ncbi:hypothetical protein [Mycobacterium sp.]|uniref:hypothetical protein n=1 Tax=Mycobacterium sp. TaxID=1785 RepID=UPI003BACC7A3
MRLCGTVAPVPDETDGGSVQPGEQADPGEAKNSLPQEQAAALPFRAAGARQAGDTAQASHPRDRWRTAWIPIMVVAALLVGIVLGSFATYLNTTDTVQARRGQVRDPHSSFGPRHDKYARILSDAKSLHNEIEFSAALFPVLNQFFLGNDVLPEMTMPSELVRADRREKSDQPCGRDVYRENLGALRRGWQFQYDSLDRTISESELVVSKRGIELARALRDKYRYEYRQAVIKGLDSLPEEVKQRLDIPSLADAFVGVAAVGAASKRYDPALLNKSTDELTEQLIQVAREAHEGDDR